MPIKLNIITIDPCAIPTKEVEIPDTCPKCGADFTEEGALVEGQFHYSNQHFSIEKKPEGDEPSWGGGSCVYESSVAVNYRCAACGQILAGEE